MIRTRCLLLLAGVALSACGEPAEIDFDPRPMNVLWLVAEDLSPYLAPYGDSTVHTPTINRLAQEGVTYTNCYSVSGVCAPSRACLATGMYPSSIGALHMRTLKQQPAAIEKGLIPYEAVPPPEVRMVSELLRNEGYYCTNNAKQDYQFRPSLLAWDESSNRAHWRNRSKDKPYFSIFNFEVTHESNIFNPLISRTSRYAREEFPLARGAKMSAVDGDPQAERPLQVDPNLDVVVPPYLPNTELVRKDVRRMYSNIVELDKYMGRILDQLEKDNLLDRTIIVFYGDHGGPLPRQKRLCYDSGLRVPLIIRYPDGRHAGTKTDRLVSFVDFAPTLLSMVGILPPQYMQGRAFAGKYEEGARTYIHAAGDRFDECVDMIRAVRDDRFKYLRNYYTDRPYYLPVEYRERMATTQELLRLRDEGKLTPAQAQWFRQTKPEEELFDCLTDPHELNNLADDSEYKELLLAMRQECDRWMTDIQDLGTTPEKELIEQFWPEGIQPTTSRPNPKLARGELFIECATPGSSIGYRKVDVEDPAQGWIPYTQPISMDPETSIEVVAHRIGYKPSEIVSVN